MSWLAVVRKPVSGQAVAKYYAVVAYTASHSGAGIVIYLSAEAMFTLRLWAFYRGNKKGESTEYRDDYV